MEEHTVDSKREFTIPVYFEYSEDFMKYSNPMFRLVYIVKGSGIIR